MDFTMPLIAGLLGFCIVIVFTIIISYDILKKTVLSNKEELSDTTSLDIRALIYINLFIILAHITSSTISLIFSSTDTDCKLYSKISVISFDVFRSLLYLIFIRRMIVIFDDTIFALTLLQKYTLYIAVFIYSIPYLIYINWKCINYKYNIDNGCLIEYKPYILHYTSSGIHILIITYSLYLFVHPLHQLIQLQDSMNTCIAEKLSRVMIKYCILHCSSVCSCVILILLSYFYAYGYNYTILDAFINGCILILLHPIHNKSYKTLCCLFHSLCAKVYVQRNETVRTSSALANVVAQKKANPETTQHSQQETQKDPDQDVDIVLAPTESEMSAPAVNIRDIMKRRVQSKFETQETQGTMDDRFRIKYPSPSSMNVMDEAEEDDVDVRDIEHKKTLSNTAVVSLQLTGVDSKISCASTKRYLAAQNTGNTENTGNTRYTIPRLSPNNSMFSLQLSPSNTLQLSQGDSGHSSDQQNKASNTLLLINFESYQL